MHRLSATEAVVIVVSALLFRAKLHEGLMDALAIVRLFYSLLASGDSAAALGLLDPKIEWTEAERTPYFAGTMHGPDAVIAGLFEPLSRDFDNFTTNPSDFISEGQRVVSFGRYSGIAQRTGRKMSAPFVHVWTVSNGRLRCFVQFTDSAPWSEALA
jgi:ketosteroid isomerase-like protein